MLTGKSKKAALSAALILSTTFGCASAARQPVVANDPIVAVVPQGDTQSALPAEWKHGPFMEIYVRGYQDSDGDGHGDLRGLIGRLDYLKSLGVSGLWLMPIMESQDKDHGYAVANYRNVEPDYGTLADLDELVAQAHKRGIGIILDYLINHSAADHPLFERSAKSVKGPFRDWYVWQTDKPKGWQIYNQDPWYPMDTGYYFAGFWNQMPDFNLRNPQVVAWHEDNLRFWLNRGVDGFRFDAVGNLIENGPDKWEVQPENHHLMKRIRQTVMAYKNRYIVCEAPGGPKGFAAPDSCGSSFAFAHQADVIGAADGDEDSIAAMSAYFTDAPAGMATLLSNHDHFAGDRPWDQLAGRDKALRLAAASYLLMPGTPFIYYGEEIGMAGAADLKGDYKLRTPMSWTSDPVNAGFTGGEPFRKLAANSQRQNVASEQGNPNSLWSFYRDVIALRHSRLALTQGDYRSPQASARTLSFQRQYGTQRVLAVFNYGRKPAKVDVSALPAGARLQALWKSGTAGGADAPATDPAGTATVELPPQSFQVYDILDEDK